MDLNLSRCMNRVGRLAACAHRLILISRALKPHKTYRVAVRAIRTHKRRIVRRGASYSGKLWMPGSEAHWKQISQVPPSF